MSIELNVKWFTKISLINDTNVNTLLNFSVHSFNIVDLDDFVTVTLERVFGPYYLDLLNLHNPPVL